MLPTLSMAPLHLLVEVLQLQLLDQDNQNKVFHEIKQIFFRG